MPNFDDIDLTDVIMDGDPYGNFEDPGGGGGGGEGHVYDLVQSSDDNAEVTLTEDGADKTTVTIPRLAQNQSGIVSASGQALNNNLILKNTNSWGYAETQTIDYTTQDTTDSTATSWKSISKLTSGLSLSNLFNRISGMMNNVRYLKKQLDKRGECVQLYNAATYANANQTFNLSQAFTNFKYIVFIYGSANNCKAETIPVPIFKAICDSSLPYKYIIYNWNNNWADITYTSTTQLKCIRNDTANTIYFTGVWGVY